MATIPQPRPGSSLHHRISPVLPSRRYSLPLDEANTSPPSSATLTKSDPFRSVLHNVSPVSRSTASTVPLIPITIMFERDAIRVLRPSTYFFDTVHVPATASAPSALARNDHVPFAVLPSKVAVSATSANSLGGKSYLAVIFFPSNERVLKSALYVGSPVTETFPVTGPSLLFSSVSSNPPELPDPSQLPDQTPTNSSPVEVPSAPRCAAAHTTLKRTRKTATHQRFRTTPPP